MAKVGIESKHQPKLQCPHLTIFVKVSVINFNIKFHKGDQFFCVCVCVEVKNYGPVNSYVQSCRAGQLPLTLFVSKFSLTKRLTSG